MVTFFTTAKPFTGHIGIIQRNALQSWTRACCQSEVILFGDEEGAVETARELGIRHVPEVERKEGGPKILRSFFDVAQKMARYETVCYANCDIVFAEDFCPAVSKVKAARKEFLMVGRRWDTDVRKPIEFDSQDWAERLRELARTQNRCLGGDWIDYFVFPRGLYLGKMPDMVIGRVHWDQWLVWKAAQLGATVVDSSEAVMAIHQNHDYGYHPIGKAGVWTDELARRNYELAGGRWHLRTIDDASHVLDGNVVRENPLRLKRAAQRLARNARESVWLTALDWTRPLRRAVGLRKKPAEPSRN